ncbi:MAG: fibronectin type III domain-containing protein, partial [Spirochaetota bacterium]
TYPESEMTKSTRLGTTRRTGVYDNSAIVAIKNDEEGNSVSDSSIGLDVLDVDIKVTETQADGTTNEYTRTVGWNSAAHVSGPDPYTPGLRMRNLTSSSVEVTWKKPDYVPDADIWGYRLVWGTEQGEDAGPKLQKQNFTDIRHVAGQSNYTYTIAKGMPRPGQKINIQVKSISATRERANSPWAWLHRSHSEADRMVP